MIAVSALRCFDEEAADEVNNQHSVARCAAIQPAAWFTAATDATSEAEDLVAEAANGSSHPVSSFVLDADGLPHRREINDKAPGGCAGCWQLYLRYSRIRRWGLKCVLVACRCRPAHTRTCSFPVRYSRYLRV